VAIAEPRLVLTDAHAGERPIDLPLATLFGQPPKMQRHAWRVPAPPGVAPGWSATLDLATAIERVLRFPAVAAKHFLITIADRSVTGLVARDQLVGPWQVAVADCAAVLTDYDGYTGAAFALGERAPVALRDAPASGRLAVGEALTNLAAAPVARLGDIKLSANWMAAADQPGEEARLYDTVRAVALELCPALGIAIPVGKDSLSMATVWDTDAGTQRMAAPLSLVVSAVAPISDARRVLTPRLRHDRGPSLLLLLDLGRGQHRLGGSALAQVYGHLGDRVPDLDDPALLKGFFAAIRALADQGLLWAYHDRGDGGLFVTLCEMAFAGRCGLEIDLAALPGAEPLAALFAEELGAVLQIPCAAEARVRATLAEHGLFEQVRRLGAPRTDDAIRLRHGERVLYQARRAELQRMWAETSWRLQRLRDHPECADEEFARIDRDDPGLHAVPTFAPDEDIAAPFIARGVRPRLAILREQGVNGQSEMAAAFDRAGFECVDLHMSDLLAGRATLADCVGLAACGGFSYGDVLGAGTGWAKTILFVPRLRDQFAAFFARADCFALGVCNGCQMLAQLRELIPGTDAWPAFQRNRSEQFEARWVMVEVTASPSVLCAGMAGSRLPLVVAHGEGRAAFATAERKTSAQPLVALRYIEHDGTVATRYPANPNGSPDGIAGLCNADGRVTILMPHPERAFRSVQYSWHPDDWGEDGPWLRLFRNARVWVG